MEHSVLMTMSEARIALRVMDVVDDLDPEEETVRSELRRLLRMAQAIRLAETEQERP